MNEIERSLVVRRSATVVDTRPVLTLTAPYHAKADLVADVSRRARRGEIRPLTARPIYNPDRGLWEHRVIRLEPDHPSWLRPVAITLAVLVLLGVLAGLTWWVLASLAAAPVAVFCLFLLFCLILLARAGKRQTVNITNNVTMR
jgi:hypothetical protein